MVLFGFGQCRGKGQRQIRFTPWPHSKSLRVTPVLGVRQWSHSPPEATGQNERYQSLTNLGRQPADALFFCTLFKTPPDSLGPLKIACKPLNALHYGALITESNYYDL